MIVVSNSSPLIALSCLDRLDILARLFGVVYIPAEVHHEVILNNMVSFQKQRISRALDEFLTIRKATIRHRFTRSLDEGEAGVLNLALEMQADLVLLDDRKARNEAKELGLLPVFTAVVLQWAAEQQLIPSYPQARQELARYQIYLPE